jgi:formyltetrahydrofolate deformylase
MDKKYRLLIEASDIKGLIYKISKILYEHQLNIEKTNEYVDKEVNKFFMRIILVGEVDEVKLLDDITSIVPKNTLIKLSPKKKKDIIILVTKEAHCLGDILIRHHSGELNANIKVVIANHNTLQELVEKFNIPFIYVPHKNLSRENHERNIIMAIKQFDYELIILAKYMRILTTEFVNTFPKQILNIHHSFLPSFIGANPYKQAFNKGVKLIGATAHYITSDLDEGPIIAQDIVRVDHTYSWQNMRDAGRNIEKVVLSNALNLLLKDQVFVNGNKTVLL